MSKIVLSETARAEITDAVETELDKRIVGFHSNEVRGLASAAVDAVIEALTVRNYHQLGALEIGQTVVDRDGDSWKKTSADAYLGDPSPIREATVVTALQLEAWGPLIAVPVFDVEPGL